MRRVAINAMMHMPGQSGEEPGQRPRRQHRQDISQGCLESEQRLEWYGRVPACGSLDRLPELFTRAHFAEVERSVAGLLQCERDGDQIVCRLLGRWPALIFAADATEWGPHAVTVRWRILGGLLSRLEPEGCGLLTMGFDVTALSGQDARLAVWSRVEGFPSRFLGPWPLIGGRVMQQLVGRAYAAYHRRVTFRYLHRVAQLLGAAR
jgi:hypothetical protein